MAAVWRIFPVTMLTVRQFGGGRTARIAFLLSLLPVVFAALYAVRPWEVRPGEFLLNLFQELIVPTLLPIVVLLPATAAFGDELEDHTLPYLLMKPVSRLRLVLGKYAAVLLATVPASLLGLVVSYAVATRAANGDDLGNLLPAMIAAAVAAAVLLSAVFLLVSLFVPRALLAGMVYIFAWESLLGRFLPGVEAISSREYSVRVFEGVLNGDRDLLANAVLTMAVVATIALALAVGRLRQMEID